MDYREEGGTDSNSESVGELPVETVEVSTIIVPNEILSTVEIPSNLETLEISAKNNEDSLEVPPIVETATETVTEIFLADAASFWDEFLEDCKAFENCTIYTSDGKFRTHKLLVSNSRFLKTLLSNEDPGDESAIILPDFSLQEVQTALLHTNPQDVQEDELGNLLDRCFCKLKDEKNRDSDDTVPVKKEEEEEKAESANSNGERCSKYLNSEGKFQCDQCADKSFNSFRILEKHLRVVHGEGEGSEGEPDDTVSEEVKLIKKSKRGRKPKKRETKRARSELADFIVEEEDENPEGDDEEEEFTSAETLRSKTSERRKPGRKPKEGDCVCDHCGKSFKIQKYLDSHITNKHPEKSEINQYIDHVDGQYNCTLCQKSFSISRRCRYHLKFKHKIGAKFTCDLCKKMFYYEYDLELHKRFHSSLRNFVCDLCGKGFLLANILANHKQSMHSSREDKEKNRKFVCSYCAKGFFSKSALHEHEFLHSEKKNFHCHICGLSFKQSSGLRAHNNRHHHASGPKVVTDEHKEKMRNYMKKYRAIKAGKLPDSINHSFRSSRKSEPPITTAPVEETVQINVVEQHQQPLIVSDVVFNFKHQEDQLHRSVEYRTHHQAGDKQDQGRVSYIAYRDLNI